MRPNRRRLSEWTFEGIDGKVKRFSCDLPSLIFDRTQGQAWDIASTSPEGNGQESFRAFKRCCEQHTPGAKRAILKQVICLESAVLIDDFEVKTD